VERGEDVVYCCCAFGDFLAVGWVGEVGTDDEDEDGHKGTTDGVERMILYYNRRGIVGNPGVLEMVLGRKVMTTEEWVERRVEEARGRDGGET